MGAGPGFTTKGKKILRIYIVCRLLASTKREVYTRIAVVFPSRTDRLACTVYLLRSFPVSGSVTSRANKENCASLTANRTCVRTVLVRWPSAQHCLKILRVSNHRFSAIDSKRDNKQC
jgi:hypothetical protein